MCTEIENVHNFAHDAKELYVNYFSFREKWKADEKGALKTFFYHTFSSASKENLHATGDLGFFIVQINIIFYTYI
jgi:hypothetical protein